MLGPRQTGVGMSDLVIETSGLLRVNDQLWTHNDSGNDPILYRIDPLDGSVLQMLAINVPNIDWEDITTDGEFIYIGDVGNNSGDRTDLPRQKSARLFFAHRWFRATCRPIRRR